MAKTRLFSREYIIPFILVTVLFFLWGIPNNLNDVLIRQFMKSFEINRFTAGLLQSAFYFGYFLLPIPAAIIMKKWGYKAGLVVGLLLYSVGTFLFYPAALSQEYAFFLFALFVIASGLAFLETGANPFIAVLGSPETSEQRLNFSQAFNPFGAITGVLIGTIFIFSGHEPDNAEIEAMKAAGTYSEFLRHETMRVVNPYLVLAGITLLWALLILLSRFPKVNEEDHGNAGIEGTKGGIRNLFSHRHFVLGVLAQFFYIGAQVGTWSYFIQYVQDYAGLPEKRAGMMLTLSLIVFLIGRFIATGLMQKIKPNKLMGIYAIFNIVLVALGVGLPLSAYGMASFDAATMNPLFGWIGIIAVLMTSFFMSLMFPTIFALGIKGLGNDTKMGASFIVMAIIGGAIFTPLMGLIAVDSMALAMLIPFGCYIFVAYYAFRGSKEIRT